ncbi:MAG: UvrB/UvrC protein [Puniceicoccaceae bacterium 5H]|nr:MAG: UvrB/UvrC protein [Puniceicoccaceae bacterium 5H]
MAKPEQCKHCQKPATIHLTQIVDNKMHQVDLCEDCPFKQGVTDPEGFSLADFLMKPPAVLSARQEALKCEECGFTPADFKKTGRFGCPHCYSTFSDLLQPMLRNMHKDVVHRGKTPERARQRVDIKRKLTEREEAMTQAISEENYEKAAEIRDEINELKKQLEAETSSS